MGNAMWSGLEVARQDVVAPLDNKSDDRNSNGKQESEQRPAQEQQPDGRTAAERLSASIWSDLARTAGRLAEPIVEKLPEAVTDALRPLSENPTLSKIIDRTALLLECPPAEKQQPPKKTQWTVALDLTTDFDGDKDHKFYRLEDLKKFAAKTKGKDVAIVVQAAFADYPHKEGTKWTYTLERYVVRDGTIKRVGKAPSKGYGQDLEDLVSYTTKNAPSDKLALIMDTHGHGNEGFHGDTGRIKLDDFIDRVKNGLKGSGREKIDLVDFDACLMAQNEVMSRVRAVTDHMVASAETEATWGISLVPIWQQLVDKPSIDAKGLARRFIREGRVQDDEMWESDGHTPLDTISYADLQHYSKFRKSLDDFGSKLADLVKEPANIKVIEECIDKSRKYGSRGGGLGFFAGANTDRYRVDLKDFADNIARAVDSGRLPDDDRSLKAAAQDVLNKRSVLVDSNFGQDSYDGVGGLSVFLPGRDLRDVDRSARYLSRPGRVATMTETSAQFRKINKDDDSRKSFLNNVASEVFWIKPHWFFFGTPGVDKETKAVDDALVQFRDAKTDSDREKAFKEIHKAAVALEQTTPFQDQHKQDAKTVRENSANLYKAQLLDDKDTTGWARFRFALRDIHAKAK